MATLERGKFIVLEGIDGAGTTTQCARIAQALKADGKQILVTREPSDGPIGVLIRQALASRVRQTDGEPLRPAAMAMLFGADRIDHLANEIEPALKQGFYVLCDRYVLSSLAYQGVENPMEWVAQLNTYAPGPDLTLFLDVDAETAATRRSARGTAVDLYENEAMQKKTIAQYRRAMAYLEREKQVICRIDGKFPIEEVTSLAIAEIQKLKP